ncbi:30S ribosomal protein S6 [Bacteroidota bacterium]
MKTNHYESVVLINAALEDDQIESTLSRIKDYISANDGKIIDIDKWGRKRLAYQIHKSKSSFYVVFKFIAPRDLITKMERFYRLDETIIRYLTIALDKKALDYFEKQKQQKAEMNEVST